MVWLPATIPASNSVIKKDRIYSFGFTVVSDDNTYDCSFEYRKADGEFAKGNGRWVNFGIEKVIMTEIVIDKKKYVLVPAKEYEALQKKAASKSTAEKTFSLEEARAYSKKLIRKWAAEK